MPFDLVDLATEDVFGPFATHQDAREAARRSGFSDYSILCEGEEIELHGSPRPHPDQAALPFVCPF
jgi:hypothetical protein